jgi:hypothetical protein
MLFDLRGRGRRRTVQIIYLFLALLMGGGLVLFGIGTGANQGGLLDALTGGGGGSSSIDTNSLGRSVAGVAAAANAAPKSTTAWSNYVQSAAQAGQESLNPTTQKYSAFGLGQLQQASTAWQHYLSLKPNPPDITLAQQMVALYQSGLNDPTAAVSAQEVVAEGSPGDAAQFIIFARLAYAAKEFRKGDEASAKAVALTPSINRPAVKQELLSARNQALPKKKAAATPTATPAGTVTPTTSTAPATKAAPTVTKSTAKHHADTDHKR